MQNRLLTGICMLMVALTAAASATVDSLISVLDTEIAQADIYINRRAAYIDSLVAVRPMTDELALQIAKEYQSYQSDSSREWYLYLNNAPEDVRARAFIGFIQLLYSCGHYDDAITLYQAAQGDPLHSVEGYKTLWLLYTDAAANAQVPVIKEEYGLAAQKYYQAMMVELEKGAPTSIEYTLWLRLYRAQERRDWAEAIRANEQLLALTTPEQHQYAILAYGNADLYEQAGNADKRLEWLVRSAITDVRLGITDNGSSWMVAQTCFDNGDLEHAFHFSDYSLTNATFFNAPSRYIQNFTPGHLISGKYEYELRQSSIRMTIVLILMAIAFAATILAVMYILRQNRRLHNLNKEITAMNEELKTINRQLKDANKVKEQYLCRYLEVYSDYIRRLTTMARKAGEKDPSAFMEREMENFYRSFDDTFLSLYGTFVQDFNALLKPEARIMPKPGERLTIEMRIYALILLGITSSAKIAELLCYSPNTISNYRVKIKKGAVGNRDTFEQRVQQIG